MTEPDTTPVKRPLGFPSIVTLIGVAAAADGLLKHRWFFLVPGLLFVVGGVALGYRTWRAYRRRYDADAAGREP